MNSIKALMLFLLPNQQHQSTEGNLLISSEENKSNTTKAIIRQEHEDTITQNKHWENCTLYSFWPTVLSVEPLVQCVVCRRV